MTRPVALRKTSEGLRLALLETHPEYHLRIGSK